MNIRNSKKHFQELLDLADIKINGDRVWDLQIKNLNFYSRVLNGGSLALGETYMEGWWDCNKIDEFFYRIFKNKLDKKVKINKSLIISLLKSKFFNLQNKSNAFQIGEKHYNIGNDLFINMLDKRMIYSCGYWKKANTLEKAQKDKLELICKKIYLQPGMKVLDIGCGWGGFAKYAAEEYDVSVVGISVSSQQISYAIKNSIGVPLEFRLQDYRDLNEEYDRIVSIGMFEHVGYKNYNKFFEIVNRNLKENGLFLLQTIGSNKTNTINEPWIEKYIFPKSIIPSALQITKASEGMLNIEDLENFGIYYDKTLMAWHNNFIKNWNKIKNNYSNKFKRMWEYYLLSCAGNFRTGELPLWQIVFSKNGFENGYKSIR